MSAEPHDAPTGHRGRGLRRGHGCGSRGRGAGRGNPEGASLQDKEPDAIAPRTEDITRSFGGEDKLSSTRAPNQKRQETKERQPRTEGPRKTPGTTRQKPSLNQPSETSNRNDPGMLSGFERVEGLVVQSANVSPKLEQSAAGFPLIAQSLYDELCAVAKTWRREISRSMFEYYLAILFHARQAFLRTRSTRGTQPDDELCQLISRTNYAVPETFQHWAESFGDFVHPDYGHVRAAAHRRPGNTGHFGEITADNHFLYASEIAPAVLESRILRDLMYTALPDQDKAWDLPPQMQTRDRQARLPTRNLLGYHTSEYLTDNQVRNLQTCGIQMVHGAAEFTLTEENHFCQTWHLNVELLERVAEWMSALSLNYRMVGFRHDARQGSKGSVMILEPRRFGGFHFDRDSAFGDEEMRTLSQTQFSPSMLEGSMIALLRPRIPPVDRGNPATMKIK